LSDPFAVLLKIIERQKAETNKQWTALYLVKNYFIYYQYV